MSVVSELSVLELNAERGDLLPEREALQVITQAITQTQAVVISQIFRVASPVPG